jgi:hypothetical protein
MEKPRLCDNCGGQINPDDIPYWMRLEMLASPEAPTIRPEDLDRDHRAEMEKLIDQMEEIGPEECEAQVYEAYKFVVCAACRNYFHEHLKHRRLDLS